MPWRPLVPTLLVTGDFRTQGEIVRALAAEGYEVNQATISRELADLGARKVDGVYRLPAEPALGVPVHRFSVTAGGCLVVVVTEPAFAMVLGQSIDDAGIDGVLGTVAGDDTVFVATSGRRATDRLAEHLGVRRAADPRRPARPNERGEATAGSRAVR